MEHVQARKKMSVVLAVGTMLASLGGCVAGAGPAPVRSNSTMASSTSPEPPENSTSPEPPESVVAAVEATPESAPSSISEWCQGIFDTSGVIDFATRVIPDLPEDRKTLYRTALLQVDGSTVVSCIMYQVFVTAHLYENPAQAAAGRAESPASGNEPIATIGGQQGQFTFSPPSSSAVMAGGMFAWESELSDFSVTISLPGDAPVDEAAAREVLDALVSLVSETPIPGGGEFCALANDIVASLVELGFDMDTGFNEELLPYFGETMETIVSDCGRDRAQEVLDAQGQWGSGGAMEYVQSAVNAGD